MKVTLVICPQVNPDKPPLSLAYLTAYLTERNIDVSCLDFNIDLYFNSNIEKKKFWNSAMDGEWLDEGRYNSLNLIDDSVVQNWLEEIEKFSPQIVGFSLLSTNYYSTLKLIMKLKARDNKVKIVIGGPEAYRLFGIGYLDILNYSDALILGEGEEIFYNLISSIKNNGEITPGKGILIKKNDILLGGDNFNLIEDMDDILFPEYSKFYLSEYKERGQLPLVFSRGCIGRCVFCFEKAYWKKFRCRSVGNVIEEIKHIKDKYRIWCFALNDSLINGNMKFLSGFCDRVISENIKISWWGMARVNNQMTEQFLNKMVKAGCVQIAYGVESGSQRVLYSMHKNYDVDMMDKVLFNTYKAGIKPGINLMLGFPGEEEEDFQATREFVKRNSRYVSYVNISTLGIEPFTEIYINRIAMGIDFKDSVNWRTLDGKNNYEIRLERAQILSKVVNEYVGKI